MTCDYPPCRKKTYGKAENRHGDVMVLCKEHYETAISRPDAVDLGVIGQTARAGADVPTTEKKKEG